MARRLKALHPGDAGSRIIVALLVVALLVVAGLAMSTALAQDRSSDGPAPQGAFRSDQASLADIDGDGRPDLVLRSLDNEIGVHLGTGNGFAPSSSVLAMGGDHRPGQALFADVNGDGRADLVFRSVSRSCTTTETICHQRGCVPALCPSGQEQLRSAWCTSRDCAPDDICTTCQRQCRDCDEMQDILVGLSEGGSFATPEFWAQGLLGENGDYDADQVLLGDLNGDRRADLVFRGAGNALTVALSTGDEFSAPEEWIRFGGDYFAGQLELTDLNGDGKSDAVFREVSTVCSDLTVDQRHCDFAPSCPDGTALVHDSGCAVTQHSSTEDITRRWTATCRSCTGSGGAFRAVISTGTGFTPAPDRPADREGG